RLRNVHTEIIERLRQRREDPRLVGAYYLHADGARLLELAVPLDLHAPIGIRIHRLLTAERVHRDAAPARDEADDRTARQPRATLGKAHQHVILARHLGPRRRAPRDAPDE